MNNRWYKFLIEQQTYTPADSKNQKSYVTKSTLDKSIQFIKDRLNPEEDRWGLYFEIPFKKELYNKIMSLENKPNGTSIEIDFEKFLEALYPESSFPGGWRKVVKDANLAREKGFKHSLSHLLNNTKLKLIVHNDLNWGYYGAYTNNGLELNFKLMEKNGITPIYTVLHEIGHWLNDGPISQRIDFESKQLLKKRGYDLEQGFTGKAFSAQEEMSYIGKALSNLLYRNNPEKYDIFLGPKSYSTKEITMVDGSKEKVKYNEYRYLFSEQESNQRWYRPIKFWYAYLRKKYFPNEMDKISFTSSKDYLYVLSKAKKEDFEYLRNGINQNLSYQERQNANFNVHSMIYSWFNYYLETILKDPNIYDFVTMTVKAEPNQKSQTA